MIIDLNYLGLVLCSDSLLNKNLRNIGMVLYLVLFDDYIFWLLIEVVDDYVIYIIDV